MFRFLKSYFQIRKHKKDLKLFKKTVKRIRKNKKDDTEEFKKLNKLISEFKDSIKKKQLKLIKQKNTEIKRLIDEKFSEFKKPKFLETFLSLFWAVLIALAIRTFIIEPFTIPTGSMIPTIQLNDNVFVNKMAYSIRIPWTRIHLLTWAKPKRGEIIIFSYPGNDADKGKDFIKRVIAVGGDRVMMKDNTIYINGKPLETTLLFKDISCMDYQSGCDHCDVYLEKNGNYSYIVQYHNPDLCFQHESSWPHKNPPDFVELDYSGKPVYFGYKKTNPNWPEVVVPKDHFLVMGDNRDNSKDSRYWGFVPMDRVMGKGLLIWWASDKKRIFSLMH